MKRFDDAAAYSAEIRRLVPGYELVHALTLAALSTLVPPNARVLVVGCGPGEELVELARAHPGWVFDALEPSQAMADAAARAVAEAGLGAQVSVHNRALGPSNGVKRDAALCLLVAHVIPDDGARERFWNDLGDSLRPNGCLALAEIEQTSATTQAIWCEWAALQGCDASRVAVLAERLERGFVTLPAARTRALAAGAGFVHERALVRALGVVADVWRRAPA